MAEEKQVIYAVTIIVLLVAAVGAFYVFSGKSAGQATIMRPKYYASPPPQPIQPPKPTPSPPPTQPPTQPQPTQPPTAPGREILEPAPKEGPGGGAIEITCHATCDWDNPPNPKYPGMRTCLDKDNLKNCDQSVCFHYLPWYASAICISKKGSEEYNCVYKCRDDFMDCNNAAQTKADKCLEDAKKIDDATKRADTIKECNKTNDEGHWKCSADYASCLIKCGLPDPSGWKSRTPPK